MVKLEAIFEALNFEIKDVKKLTINLRESERDS